MVHRESRDSDVYALVAEKKGTKLKEGAPDAKGFLNMYGATKITGSGAPMSLLAGWLANANIVDRPVVDQTGLTGKYDFSLEWSNALAATTDSPAPSIFTALKEQLGLKLEPARAPLEILVIDRAELPGDN